MAAPANNNHQQPAPQVLQQPNPFVATATIIFPVSSQQTQLAHQVRQQQETITQLAASNQLLTQFCTLQIQRTEQMEQRLRELAHLMDVHAALTFAVLQRPLQPPH